MADKNKKLRIIWSQMKTRCYNKNRKDYVRYGGRGIRVCAEWLNVNNFLRDMKYSYEFGLSLDRIDNNKDYSKYNCRWATKKQQANNTRNIERAIKYTFEGVTLSIKQWAEQMGIKRSTLYMRLKYNWPIKRALERRVVT